MKSFFYILTHYSFKLTKTHNLSGNGYNIEIITNLPKNAENLRKSITHITRSTNYIGALWTVLKYPFDHVLLKKTSDSGMNWYDIKYKEYYKWVIEHGYTNTTFNIY